MFVRPDGRRSENYGAGSMTDVAIRTAFGQLHTFATRKYAIAYCKPWFICHRI